MKKTLSLPVLLSCAGFLVIVLGAAGCQGAAPGPDGGASGRGLVRLATSAQTIVGRQVFQTQAGAIFSGPQAGCPRQEAGACAAYVCQPGGGRQPDAGAITLGSGAAAVTLGVQEDGGYKGFLNTTAALWGEGQRVAVSARGGVVPAFTGEVEMPAAAGFTLSQPAISPMLTVTLAQGADLALSWTGGGAQVRLEIGQDLDTAAGRLIVCAFPGEDGRGAVPASLLMTLLPTVGVEHGALFLMGPARTSRVEIGQGGGNAWSVEIAAIGGGKSALAQITAPPGR
jgi:hypothetical protein